jgi:hypothetical protein
VGRGSASFLALAAVAVTAGAAASAQAGASADYNAVKSDWRKDGKITPCRFSLPELQHASELAAANNEDGYTTLPDEIGREIGRWNSGGCRKVGIARLRLSVSPRTAKQAKSTSFTFTVTVPTSRRGQNAALAGAAVSFAGRSARTDSGGRATITTTIASAGKRTAAATRRGLRSASATVRVR